MPSEAPGTVVPETEAEIVPETEAEMEPTEDEIGDEAARSDADPEAAGDATDEEAAGEDTPTEPVEAAGEDAPTDEADAPTDEADTASEAPAAPASPASTATAATAGDPVAAALEAVAGARSAFRSVVATTAEDVRSFLQARTTPPEGRAERAALELGRMGPSHIDPERFSALLGEEEVLDAQSLKVVEEARRILAEVADADDDLYRRSVERGGDLRGAVDTALAEAGRAFGAARAVTLVRKGGYRPDDDWELLHPLPFRRWSRAEREVAPPLVVRVAGRDLVPGGLSEFLDGSLKLVLVVEGPSPLAPLARLVCPGVFVLQTSDPAELALLADVEGPAVAALLPPEAVRFRFDPRKGDGVARGLELDGLPDTLDATPGMALSASQQARDLATLRELIRFRDGATAPRTAPAANGATSDEAATGLEAPPAGSPADRLAAWLLKKADL